MKVTKEVDDGMCRSCVADKCVTGPECVTLGRDSRATDLLLEEIGLYALAQGEAWRTGEGAAIMDAYEALTKK